MRIVYWLAGALALCAGPAAAALTVGAPAPDFSAPAAMGGKVSAFSLAEALRHGPVVLYFYPAAFTPGCTQEAHDFADAMDQFRALGATVIGVSEDAIEKLKRFSVSACRSRFPVASDADGHITYAYDAVLIGKVGRAERTSYVIAPDGHILYSYTALDPDGHVAKTLAALRAWRASRP